MVQYPKIEQGIHKLTLILNIQGLISQYTNCRIKSMSSVQINVSFQIENPEIKHNISGFLGTFCPHLLCKDVSAVGNAFNIQFIDSATFHSQKHQLDVMDATKFPCFKSQKFVLVHGDANLAIDALRAGVYDYILPQNLEHDIPMLIERILKEGSSIQKSLDDLSDNQYLIIKDNRFIKRLQFSDILFIEAYGSYSNIYTHEKNYTVSKTIKTLTKDYPSYIVRVHRSYAINMNYVVSYNSEEVVLVNNNRVKISRGKKNAFNRAMEVIA